MISRGLAYLSTVIHVRCLNFRVRNGNGCDTPAVAAIESQDPDLNRSVVDLQSTAWPLRHLGLACSRLQELASKLLAFQNFVWVCRTGRLGQLVIAD